MHLKSVKYAFKYALKIAKICTKNTKICTKKLKNIYLHQTLNQKKMVQIVTKMFIK